MHKQVPAFLYRSLQKSSFHVQDIPIPETSGDHGSLPSPGNLPKHSTLFVALPQAGSKSVLIASWPY
jgi:hypothetical protein